MTPETKAILIKRTKSFLWRMGCIVGVAIIDFIGQQVQLFALPQTAVLIIGLVLGEVTKYLNTNVK